MTNAMANKVLIPLLRRGGGGGLGRRLAVVEYRGRRSGQHHELVTMYAMTGGTLRIRVGLAEHKTWWRNFEGGHPMLIRLAGKDYATTARVVRETDLVSVVAELDVGPGTGRHGGDAPSAEQRSTGGNPVITQDATRSSRPTGDELFRQLTHVIADLPLFLTAPLYRRWHLRWGATAQEAAARLPGDQLFPHAQFRSTRAITIKAPPASVWPWLVQVGCLRGGFYSHDLLDNLGHPSARRIIPELQHLRAGQWVPMSPTTPSEATALRVDGFETNRWLLWRTRDSTWAWTLVDLGDGNTRLVSRIHATYPWERPLSALLAVVLMEFGDFAMMRRMLYGIKERAEALPRSVGERELSSAR